MAERGCGVPGGKGELVDLTPGDVTKLSEQLHDIAAVWDLFVGQLGVPRSKQQQISRKNTNHPAFAQICLVDGLQHWVASDPLPTVEKVIVALSSRTINNKLLAAEIGRQWGVQVVEEPAPDVQSSYTTASQPEATTPDGQTNFDIPHAKAKINELKRNFISLVRQLKQHLKATLTDGGLPTFRDEFILELPLSVTDENEKFFNRRNAEINKATTFNELFTCLSTHWSYMNHSLLGGIIMSYGTEVQQHAFNEFCKDVECFRKLTTVEVFREIEPPPRLDPPAGFEEFVTRHALSLTSTLEDLECIRHKFCEKFHLHKFVFYLVRVLKGSVVITWLVPHSVARLLEAELTQELIRELTILHIEDIIYTDKSGSSMDPVPAAKDKAIAVVAARVVECISQGNLVEASAQLDTIKEDSSVLAEHAENLSKRIEKVIEYYQTQDDELKRRIDSHRREEQQLYSLQKAAEYRLSTHREYLSQCQRSLSEAQRDLEVAKSNRLKKEAAVLTGSMVAGLILGVLTFGLGAGVVLGAGAAATAAIVTREKQEEDAARQQRDRRQDNVRSAQSQVSRTSSEISSIQSKISRLRSQIESKQRQRNHKEMEKVRESHKRLKEALVFFTLFRSAANSENMNERTVLLQEIMETTTQRANQQKTLKGMAYSRVIVTFQDACDVLGDIAADF